MGQRVLVVDDSPFIQELVSDILVREGYAVERAMNGQEAMEAIGQNPPDLVLLDIVMPEMSGYQVCRLIRGDARLRALPVVMMTAKDTQKDRFWGMEVGADAYITKPIEAESLLPTVSRLLREARAPASPVGREELSKESLKGRAEELLERRLLELTVLNEAGKLFVFIDRPDLLLQSVLGLLARVVDFDLGAVFVALPGAPEKVLALSYRNVPLKVSKKALIRRGSELLAQRRGCEVSALAALETRVLEDGVLGRDAARRPPADEASVVLETAHGPLGVVLLSSSRAEAFVPDDRSLLEIVASQIAVLLDNVRLLQERDRQVAVLELEKRRVEAILRNMGEGVVVTDWSYRVIHANPLAHRLLGVAEGELEGRPLFDHVPRETFGVLEDQPIGERNPVWTVRFSSLREKAPLVANVAVVDEKEEQTLGLIMLLRDTSADRELDRVRARFLENVSNALRNPLTSLRGFYELLRDEGYAAASPRQREFLDVMNAEMARLAESVEDLLSLSRVELGERRLRPEDVPVAEAVLTAVINGQGEAQSRGTSLRTEFGAEVPRARADRESVVDVVGRLIHHALRHGPEGGEVVAGAVRSSREGRQGWPEVFVLDRGPLLSLEMRAAAFDKPVERSLAEDDVEASGLGLAICRRLVEVNGGVAGVEPAEGGVNRFFFVLPPSAPPAADRGAAPRR